MKHIVIGGAGFIARHLRIELAEHDVILIDKKSPANIGSNETWIKWDIRDEKANVKCEVDKDTVVHHLAAVHFDFQTDFFETNVIGTKNVIARFSECQQWVFYSSVATYGDSTETRSETSKQLPTNDYGQSKLEMEELILQSHDQGLLKGHVVVVRPGVVYGEWNFGNVFNLMWLSTRFKPVGLNRNPTKSMAYVKNLVASTMFALEQRSYHVGSPVLIYNYVDYEQLGTKDLLSEIGQEIGKRPLFLPFQFVWLLAGIISFPFRLLGMDFIVHPMRVSKLAQPTHFSAEVIRKLGFQQTYSPQQGIRNTIRWIRSNRVGELRTSWKASFKGE